MPYKINHIHIKSLDPKATADWYVEAFGFEIVTDDVRAFGDRFIRCRAQDTEPLVMISGPRTGETLNAADGNPRLGLEHFGLDSQDIPADVARLEALGAELVEGPFEMPGNVHIAFMKVPGEVRIELIQRPPAKG